MFEQGIVASLDRLLHQYKGAVETLRSMSWRRKVGFESTNSAERRATVTQRAAKLALLVELNVRILLVHICMIDMSLEYDSVIGVRVPEEGDGVSERDDSG